jgi:4-hydroxyphenylpyruvate dioxygenase
VAILLGFLEYRCLSGETVGANHLFWFIVQEVGGPRLAVQQVGAPNLGLVVDAFHIFVSGRDASDLDGIPMDAIYLVQLSDLDYTLEPDELIETARHHRLLPGRGHFPIRSILKRFEQGGYAGPIGLEVFNDDLKAGDPMVTAADAMAALRETLAQSALFAA